MNNRVALFRSDVADLGAPVVRRCFSFMEDDDNRDKTTQYTYNQDLYAQLVFKDAYVFKVRLFTQKSKHFEPYFIFRNPRTGAMHTSTEPWWSSVERCSA
jgi:hypothetical protein